MSYYVAWVNVILYVYFAMIEPTLIIRYSRREIHGAIIKSLASCLKKEKLETGTS